MKKILIFSIIAVLAYVKISYAQQNSTTITFNKILHDFGSINEKDGVVSCKFEFVNSGKSPLIIQRVISSCDCATTDWTKEPIIPGSKNSITVYYNTKDRPGKFDKVITVYSNAETSTVVLHIKGIVLERTKSLEELYNRALGEFRFKKTNLSFSSLLVDKTKTDTLEFVCMSKEPTKIGCKIEGYPHLSVKFVPENLQPNEKGLMIVTYDAKKRNDWGFVIDRFNLTQNDKEINGGLITISASIEENFTSLTEEQRAKAPVIQMVNANFDWGQIEEGQPVECEFAFKNTGKSDLIIRKIKPSCGCTTVEPSNKVIKPGQSSSFKVTIKTNGLSGRNAKSITLISNDPVTPVVAIRISGTVNPAKK
jgi:hypothetical protein